MSKISPLKILKEDPKEAELLKDKFLIDLQTTKSLTKTAKNFGYSDGRIIENFLREFNINLSIFERTKISKEQELEICKLYNQGMSQVQISKLFNTSRERISRILKRNNIALRTSAEVNSIITEAQKFIPSKEKLTDLADFYKYHSLNDTAEWLGCKNTDVVKRLLIENNIHIRTEQEQVDLMKNNLKRNIQEKYGVNYILQVPEVKQKIQQAIKEKYGVDNIFQAEEIKDKIKETCKKKYNTEFAAQSNEIKEKIVQTNIKKYGCEYFNQTGEAKDYKKQKNKEMFGVEFYFQTEDFKEKSKQTCLEKYGVTNGGGSNQAINKSITTCLEKYGVNNYTQTKEYLQKSYATRKKNHTFNSSKPEDIFYQKLVEKYGEQNIIRQYKDIRYPFMCDFYIKSLDQFIELNLHWTHGGHLFDPNNLNDLKKLERWKEKAKYSNYYKNAIETWTKRDLNKIYIAQKAKINYKAIYSFKEA